MMEKSAGIRIGRVVRLLTLAAMLTVCYASAAAQSDASRRLPGSDASDEGTLASPEEEMRAKRAIQSVDKAHKDNVERARDLASLGTSLGEAFKAKQCLDAADVKKLEKAEKLAKRIREAAGGEDDNGESEKPPRDMADAMSRFTELTASLKDKVEKTPKRVISTAIIDDANTLLALIRSIRGMQPKT